MTARRLAAPGVVLLLYLAASFALLAAWNRAGWNPPTGDEPHYLVMARGLARHGAVEQTRPYREEFRERALYPAGFAPPGAEPSPENTHTFRGPRGLFNLHGLGLPLLLAIPVALLGVVGAQVAMVLLGGLAVVAAWKVAGDLGAGPRTRLLATAAACLGPPLLPNASQIYPDLLAGAVLLGGLHGLLTRDRSRPASRDLALAAALAFLPWLQVRFAAPALLVLGALALSRVRAGAGPARVALLALPGLLSLAALAAFHLYAFGRLSGPHGAGALEVSRTSAMVLAGLLIDQNQGFLLRNPVMLAGVFATPLLFRVDRYAATAWLLVLLSLLVPNALHPNWYGGTSFAGRFGWAAGLVFLVPTLLGLVRLGQALPGAFLAVVAGSLLLQATFLLQLARVPTDLYRRAPDTPPHLASIHHETLRAWLPALHDPARAFGHLPNLAWGLVVLALLVLGAVRARDA